MDMTVDAARPLFSRASATATVLAIVLIVLLLPNSNAEGALATPPPSPPVAVAVGIVSDELGDPSEILGFLPSHTELRSGAPLAGARDLADLVGVKGAALITYADAAPRIGNDLALTGPRVVQYDVDKDDLRSDLRKAFQIVRRGTPTETNGCEFPGQVVSSSSSETLVARELAYDPESCALLVEVAIAVPDESEGPPLSTDEQQPVMQEGEEGIGVAALRRGYEALSNSKIKDPPGLTVTWTETRIRWFPTSSCAYNGQSPLPTAYVGDDWLEQTGWVRDIHVWDPQFNCTRVYSKLHAKYHNDPFCGPASATIAHHWPTYVEGLREYNGFAPSNHGWNTTKEGGCSALLRVVNTYVFSHRFQ